MRVDGVPNLYTCQVPAKNGMRVQRQNAYPSAETDVFRAIDWMFPHGMDHHQMFAGVPIAEKVMAKVARHLSGLGLLPDLPAPQRPAPEAVRTAVAIVGGGAAGLAAASELARQSIPFLLCEAEGFLGGRLAVAPIEADAPPMPPALPSSDAVRLRARAIAIYDHREGPGVLAIEGLAAGPRLLKVVADRYLIAVGGHPALIPFENNDLPGVFAGRAVSYLIRKWGLIPGHLFALVRSGREIHPLAQLLEASGGRVAAIVPTSGATKILKAHGRTQVRGLSFETADGPQRVACDAVVVAEDPSPSFALAE
jgi:sarcosine oxidase subunit alpha